MSEEEIERCTKPALKGKDDLCKTCMGCYITCPHIQEYCKTGECFEYKPKTEPNLPTLNVPEKYQPFKNISIDRRDEPYHKKK